jgi:hypothetical protein
MKHSQVAAYFKRFFGFGIKLYPHKEKNPLAGRND